jgi:alpha-ribazole phosphatase
MLMRHNLYFIRHGKTDGNIRGEYVGATDQPLCAEGIAELNDYKHAQKYPAVDHIFVSPMIRCLQTMLIIYPDIPYSIIPGLRECDFGIFEGKTHGELKENREYQKWIDQGGKGVFPAGEHTETFKERCRTGFQDIVSTIVDKKILNSALIIHGGSIMSILESYAKDPVDFFHWRARNGQGYKVVLDDELWEKNQKFFEISAL